MAAIVSSGGLGLATGSLGVLGGSGVLGNAGLGRGGEGAYVNAANGNLVLRRQDELLIGVGLDIGVLRSYNSQGLLNDDNGDNWRLGFSRKVVLVSGSLNGANSVAKRTEEDGSESLYTYNSGLGIYVSTSGAGAFDTLSYDAGNQKWAWTDGDSLSKETYDNNQSGRLVDVTDADGNKLSLSYTNGLLSAITDQGGQVVYIDYDTAAGKTSNIVQIRTLSNGVTQVRTRYTYDSLNRLTEVATDLTPQDATDNSNAATQYKSTYTYDGTSRRIASLSQSDGSRQEFVYEQVPAGGAYRISQVKDVRGADIRITSFAYDTALNKTTVTDALGQVTELTYDTNGQLLGVKAPAVNGVAQQVSFSYDADVARFGNVLTVTDARGQVTTYEYDGGGNRVLERDGSGNTLKRTYSNKNELLTETRYLSPDPDGAGSGQSGEPLTTRYAYDNKSRLRFVVSAQGRVTEYKYDQANGNMLSSIQYSGNLYSLSALAPTDGLSESQLTSWAGTANRQQAQRTDYGYDLLRGQMATQTTYAQLDASGNGLATGAAITRYVYSQAGELLQVIDARGEATADPNDYVTTYAYDGLGRLFKVRDAAGVSTITTYDDVGRRTTITLANGQTTVTAYNEGGQALSVTAGNGLNTLGTTTYTYDKLDRLRLSVDATGGKHFYLFDEAGRQVGEVDATGALTEYRYNKNNQLIGTFRYANALSVATLATAATDPTVFSLAQAKASLADAANDRTGLVIYNGAGQVAWRIDGEGALSQYAYDGAGRLTQSTRYAKALGAAQMSALANLAATRELTPADVTPTQDPSNDRIERSFYDAQGLLLGKLDAEGYLSEYKYDAAGQLVQSNGYINRPSDTTVSFAQMVLNITKLPAQDQSTYTLYNARGQVEGIIDAEGYLTEWQYDAAGNQTTIIRYNTPVTYAAGATVTNVRPILNAEDQTVSSIFDARNLLTQQTGADGTVTTYVYDDLGRSIASTRAAGTSEARASRVRYDAFGRLTQELSGEGAKALDALINPTQPQIDALWAQYGIVHTYDKASRRTSTADALGKTLFYYDAQGRLTHTINALGEVRLTTYNAFGEVKETRAFTKPLTNLSGLNGGLMDTALSNSLATLNSSSDQTSTLTYTTAGQLRSKTDGLGIDSIFTYNAFGELFRTDTKLDAGHRRLDEYTYDRRGLLKNLVEDKGTGKLERTTEWVYDAFGRRTDYTDANHRLWKTVYDRLGRVIETHDLINPARLTTYDAHSRVLTQRDALGNTTTYKYDTVARSLTIETPEGVKTVTVSNRHGQTDSITDGKLNTTTYSYNANGQLEKVTAPAAQTGDPARISTNVYNNLGQLQDSFDANGTKITYLYDNAGRLSKRIVDPQGLALTTTYRYDGQGRGVWVQDANLVWTQTLFDAAGRTVEVIVDPKFGPDWISGPQDNPNGLNLHTTYVYDGSTKLTVTEGAGPGVTNPKVIEYHYDSLGRRTQEIVDPGAGRLNLKTSYAYDGNGNVVTRTDALGYITRYVYGPLNRLQYSIDATGAALRSDYDAEGHVIATTVYANRISLPSQLLAPTATDIVNALSVGLVPADNIVTRTVYDKDGHAVFGIDGTGALIEHEYDKNGNVTKTIAYAARPIFGAYDLASVRIAASAIADPTKDRVTQNVYDKANRLLDSTDAMGAVTHYSYDLTGNVINAALAYGTPDESITHYDYDTAGRLKAETRGYGSLEAATISYNLDKLGRRTDVFDPLNNKTTNVFDAAGRLIEAISPSDVNGVRHSIKTTYDALGRAVKVTDQLGNSGYFYFDSAGRTALHVDPEGYVVKTEYDAAGNTVAITRYAKELTGIYDETTTRAALETMIVADGQDATTRIEHDALGRQTKIIDAEGYSEYLDYDTFGNKKTYTNKLGGMYRYTYDKRGKMLAEMLPFDPAHPADSAYSISTRNALGQVIAVVNSFEYDARGNLIRKIEAEGVVEQRTTTFAYDRLDRQITQTGDLLAVFDPATQTSSTAASIETRKYDTRGNLVEIDVNGAKNLNYYDELDRKTATVNSVGGLTTYKYDAAGNLVTQTSYATVGGTPSNPIGSDLDRIVHYKYDTNGRRIQSTIEGVLVVSPQNTDAVVTTDLKTYTDYDAAGNVIREQDARGNSIYHYYDKLGRQVAQLDQLRYLTTWVYESGESATEERRFAKAVAPDNTNSAIPPALATLLNTVQYDNANDRRRKVDYDRMGRVLEEKTLDVAYGEVGATGALTQGAATARTHYAYNGLGAVTKIEVYVSNNTAETTDFEYDLLGRKMLELNPEITEIVDADDVINPPGTKVRPATSYVYNGLNQLLSETMEGGAAADRVTAYRYGESGRLLQKRDAAGSAVEVVTYYSYDVNGRVARAYLDRKDIDNHNYKDTTDYYYDAQGRETKRQTWSKEIATGDAIPIYAASDLLETKEILYDLFGNIADKRTYGGNSVGVWQENAAYDKLGRVWKSNAGDGAYKLYVYDANGNSVITIRSAGDAQNDPDASESGLGVNLAGVTETQLAAGLAGVYLTKSEYDARNQLVAVIEPTMPGVGEPASIGQIITQQTGQDYSAGVAQVHAPVTSTPAGTGSATIGAPQVNITLTLKYTGTVNTDAGESGGTMRKLSEGNSDNLYIQVDTSMYGETDRLKFQFVLSPSSGNLFEFEGYNSGNLRYIDSAVAKTGFNFSFAEEAVGASSRNENSDAFTQAITATRSFYVKIYKETAAGDVYLGKFNGTAATRTITSQTSAGETTTTQYKRTGTIAKSLAPMLIFKGLPSSPAPANVVLQYRVKDSGTGWSLAPAVKMLNNSGAEMSGWFGVDWTSWARNTYEVRYMVFDAGGNMLQSKAGVMILSDSMPSIVVSNQSIGGGGDAFMDAQGNLHFVEQPAGTTSLKVKYKKIGENWASATEVTLGSLTTYAQGGWFKVSSGGWSAGDYEYVIEAYNGANELLNGAYGRFTTGLADSVSGLDSKAVYFEPDENTTRFELEYRLKSAQNWITSGLVLPMISGYDWHLVGLASGIYEFHYKAYSSANVILNAAVGEISIGDTAATTSVLHHIGGTPTNVEIASQNTQAFGLRLYYSETDSSGTVTYAVVILSRSTITDPFVWDASVEVAPGTARSIDFRYELLDINGQPLLIDDRDPTSVITVYGTINVSNADAPQTTHWTLSGLANTSINIRREQAYNAFGEVSREWTAPKAGEAANVTEYSYNALGKMVEKKDPETNSTDRFGVRTRIRPTTNYVYDLGGRLVGVYDPNRNLNTQSWLAGTGLNGDAGKVAVEYHADDGKVVRGYDRFGDLRTYTDLMAASNSANNALTARTTRYAYDELGRMTALSRPTEILAERYSYDSAGNRIQDMRDAVNSTDDRFEKTYYDALGRVTKTVTPENLVTQYAYQYEAGMTGIGGQVIGGYKIITTLPNGRDGYERKDIFNHLISSEDYGGHIFQYDYNYAGWLIKQTSLGGNNAYDGVVYTGQYITFGYFANGDLQSIYDRTMHTFTGYEYDRSGRRTLEYYRVEQQNATNGQWLGNWDYYQNARISYDELGRVKQIDDPRALISYDYDANGNRRRVYSYFHDGVHGKKATQEYWYDYDSMNRFTITMGRLNSSGAGVEIGTEGTKLEYDKAGQRTKATYRTGTNTTIELYQYSKDGYLTTAEKPNEQDISRRYYNAFGEVVYYAEYRSNGTDLRYSRTSEYDKDGRLTYQAEINNAYRTTDENVIGQTSNTTYTYGNAGKGPLSKTVSEIVTLKRTHPFETNHIDPSYTITSNYSYEWWDDAKQLRIKTQGESPQVDDSWKPGYSRFEYDVNGHLTAMHDPANNEVDNGRSVRFITNAEGMVLRRDEISGGTALPNSDGIVQGGTVGAKHYFYYINGARVGDVGNDGNELKTSNLSYAEQLAERGKVQNPNAKWKPIVSADFDQSFQPVNANYPAATGTTYTAHGGETLQSIAAIVWGDTAMWYLIADANGLAGTEVLTAGQVLSIPNKVTNIHNNSQTFKVYDAGQAIGNTMPTLPDAPPNTPDSCGPLGIIIMAVITMIVAYYAGPACTATLSQTLGPTTAAIVGGAMGAAFGSIVGQGVGVIMGVQQKISWRAVAMAAAGGAIGAGVGEIVPGLSGATFPAMLGRALVGNILTQGFAVATGLQKKFDWAGVAAAGIGAVAGYGMNQLLGRAQFGPTWDIAQGRDSGAPREDPQAIANARNEIDAAKNSDTTAIRNRAVNVVSSVVETLVRGDKPDWAGMALQSFGQMLGGRLIQSISKGDEAPTDDSIGWPDGSSYIKGFDVSPSISPVSAGSSGFNPGLAANNPYEITLEPGSWGATEGWSILPVSMNADQLKLSKATIDPAEKTPDDVAAKAKALADAKERVEQLERNVADLKTVVAIKAEIIANLKEESRKIDAEEAMQGRTLVDSVVQPMLDSIYEFQFASPTFESVGSSDSGNFKQQSIAGNWSNSTMVWQPEGDGRIDTWGSASRVDRQELQNAMSEVGDWGETLDRGITNLVKLEATWKLNKAFPLQAPNIQAIGLAGDLEKSAAVFKSSNGQAASSLLKNAKTFGTIARGAGLLGFAASIVDEGIYVSQQSPENQFIASTTSVVNTAGGWVAATAGAKAGAVLGTLGGPLAWLTVPIGAAVGGMFGYFAYDRNIKPAVRNLAIPGSASPAN